MVLLLVLLMMAIVAVLVTVAAAAEVVVVAAKEQMSYTHGPTQRSHKLSKCCTPLVYLLRTFHEQWKTLQDGFSVLLLQFFSPPFHSWNVLRNCAFTPSTSLESTDGN